MEKEKKQNNLPLIIIGIAIFVVIVIFSSNKSDNVPNTDNTISDVTSVKESTTINDKKPQTPEEKQQILANQIQCSKDGNTYNINFWHSTDNSNMNGMKNVWDTPEYHYNSQLNTCLLYERYIQYDKYNNSLSYQYDQIIDVYSNKTILTGFFTRDVSTTPYKEDVGYFGNSSNGVPNYTSDEFYRQKNLLFNQ